MSILAAIRPDDWNFPLLVHVLGAALLVGGLVTAVTALLLGWRRDSAFYTRFAFRTLLFFTVPAWVIMRIGAQWIYSKENYSRDTEPDWMFPGIVSAEGGGALLVVTIVLTWLGVRQLRTRQEPTVFARVAGVLATLILFGYIVAVWTMTAKPG